MRGSLIVTALLAALLAGCGGTDSNSSGPDAAKSAQQPALDTGGGEAVAPVPPAASAKSKKATGGTYVAPSVVAKTRNGGTPGVLLLPDTGADAAAEVQQLAKLGVATVVVKSPASVPRTPKAFEQAVSDALRGLNQLRGKSGIDRTRIGVIGDGVGAHVAAVAVGRAPDKVLAAVLADVGGAVVPAKEYAPERWLERAEHTEMLFQRDTGRRAMTSAEVTRLMVAAPPGTLMQEYKDLGPTAQAARDSWMTRVLVGT